MDLQPRDVLRMAWEAVEGADVPVDLRPIAFTTVVDLVVTGRVTPVPAAPPARSRAGQAEQDAASSPPTPPPGRATILESAPEAPRESASPFPGPQAPPPSGYTAHAGAAALPPPPVGAPTGALGGLAVDMVAIAEHIGVRVERLDRLYDAHHGVLELCGDPARFGRTRAERVGNVVLLLLAAMRWSQRDGGHAVPDALVRAEVSRLGLLDVGNYSKHLAARRSLWATTGSGRSASYRVRYDGLEEARRLARTLLEEPAA